MIQDVVVELCKEILRVLGPEVPDDDWEPAMLLIHGVDVDLVSLPGELLENSRSKAFLRTLIATTVEEKNPDIVALWSSAWARRAKLVDGQLPPGPVEQFEITGEIVFMHIVSKQGEIRTLRADIARFEDQKPELVGWKELDSKDSLQDLFVDSIILGFDNARREHDPAGEG